jgi:peroxiredoxin
MKKRLGISLVAALSVLSCFAALPEVTLRSTDGKEVNVSTLGVSGKPVIISFFATWCKPCMREIKAIDELYADWQDETGVEMYLVSVDQGQDVQKVAPLVNGYGWEYKVLLDPNGSLKRAMNVQNVPHLFVVNSKGEIVYNHTGYSAGDETEIEKYLR